MEVRSVDLTTNPYLALAVFLGAGLEDDPITDQVLGEELSREYAAFKKEEWWDYHHTVSDWELDTYVKLR